MTDILNRQLTTRARRGFLPLQRCQKLKLTGLIRTVAASQVKGRVVAWGVLHDSMHIWGKRIIGEAKLSVWEEV